MRAPGYSRVERSIAGAGVALAVFLLSVGSAEAVSDRVRAACTSDYFTHCSAHEVGSPALRQCMRSVGVGLSKPCLTALVADGESRRAMLPIGGQQGEADRSPVSGEDVRREVSVAKSASDARSRSPNP